MRAELIFGLTLKLENLVEFLKKNIEKILKFGVWESASIYNYKKKYTQVF